MDWDCQREKCSWFTESRAEGEICETSLGKDLSFSLP